MTPKDEVARQKLAALEADPKHTTPNEDAHRQTKDDDINDPANHDLTGEVDPRWTQDKNGNWIDPDDDLEG